MRRGRGRGRGYFRFGFLCRCYYYYMVCVMVHLGIIFELTIEIPPPPKYASLIGVRFTISESEDDIQIKSDHVPTPSSLSPARKMKKPSINA